MKIKVCIGSSCHLKGSHEIVELLRNRLKETGMDGQVELTGSFCMGQCGSGGVSVQVDDQPIYHVTPANFDAFFETTVASAARTE